MCVLAKQHKEYSNTILGLLNICSTDWYLGVVCCMLLGIYVLRLIGMLINAVYHSVEALRKSIVVLLVSNAQNSAALYE